MLVQKMIYSYTILESVLLIVLISTSCADLLQLEIYILREPLNLVTCDCFDFLELDNCILDIVPSTAWIPVDKQVTLNETF